MQSGIIVLNKSTGMSSACAVGKLKRVLGVKKIGHLGTLDPLGSGVLPIAINKATKLFDFLNKKKKTYRTVFTFGIETDTLDSEGAITKVVESEVISEKINFAIKKFVGVINQLPPIYSAKKVNGKAAYKLAREGAEANLTPKEVEIYRFELTKQLEKNTFLFEIECSSGTYIRSLCHDLAAELSTCGVMSAICRTKSGIFNIEHSSTIEEVMNGEYKLFELADIIPLPRKEIDTQLFNNFLNGKKIDAFFDEPEVLLMHNGKAVAICTISDGTIKSEVYLWEEENGR